MKSLTIALSFLAIIVIVFLFANNNTELPKGWFPSGNKPSEFKMGIDYSTHYNGNSSAYIQSKSPAGKEFGTLMQTIKAENYLGKRLRLSGYIKSEDVEGWSGMWMRIDGENYMQMGFDNMRNRPIKGTSDWKKYEIVLDIPPDSKSINYGVLLNGDGKVWFDDFKLEEVDDNVPVTNIVSEKMIPDQPVNLDFEE
ncbi:hypothetical protein LJE86_16980 [bacterium BMS3Abin03]|jgi:hypothetical protein|nr:hypothetical protein [bacterium BMS3Abin03]MCG6960652.1 hypothetical protein [bacterium BMS3Abin03]